MEKTTQQRNKDIVLEAFDTLFNKRDYAKAETFWSPKYIQHSAHIEPGREGLFNLIKSIPATLKYEPGLIVAEGDFVILHGRFSGMGLPGRAAKHGGGQIQALQRRRGQFLLTGADHQLDTAGRIESAKRLRRPAQHRLPGQAFILFWQS